MIQIIFQPIKNVKLSIQKDKFYLLFNINNIFYILFIIISNHKIIFYFIQIKL